MSDAACWIRSLRQLMGEGGTACCAAGEGRRGGRSGFERALGLHFRMLRLIGAVIRYCGRCSHLSAGDANNQAEKQHPLSWMQEETGRSQAFLTSLGLEQIFAYELPGHNHSANYTLKSQYPQRQLLNSKCPLSHLQATSLRPTRAAPLPTPPRGPALALQARPP